MSATKYQSKELLQVLRLPQVCKVTGLCRSLIYKLEAEQRFPGRIKIGLRAVGWIEGEVQEWLAVRIERSRGSLSISSEFKNQ
jgi:prophage regulatory protein